MTLASGACACTYTPRELVCPTDVCRAGDSDGATNPTDHDTSGDPFAGDGPRGDGIDPGDQALPTSFVQLLSSAGGHWTGDGFEGFSYLGPVDVATSVSSNSELILYAGPLIILQAP